MKKHVHIDYTNHRGDRRMRTVEPIEIRFMESEWHAGRQWILRAKDLEDPENRIKDFAMVNINRWDAAP